MTQDERNIQNNANNVRNAAEVAIASGNPYAMAAGAAVKAADKISGGKSSEMLGKQINQANKQTPGGDKIQDSLNKMSESGASDKIGQAAAAKNAANGEGTGTTEAAKGDGAANGTDKKGSDSSSSDSSEKKGPKGFGKKKPSILDDEENGETEDGEIKFATKQELKTVTILMAPLLGIVFLFFAIAGAVGGGVADFDDALGANEFSGGDTGNIIYTGSNPEAKKFYERINTVKLSMQVNGKSVDVLKVVAVYHVLNVNNNSYITPLKDQGNLGICWTLAASEQIESYLMIKNSTPYNSNSLTFSSKE